MSPSPRKTLSLLAAAGVVASMAGMSWLTTGAALGGGAAPEHNRCRLPGPYELPHGASRIDLDPADFTPRITNPYWPMKPGSKWTYRETDGKSTQRVTIRVTDRTRMVRGIKARVVHDVVREHGDLVENTFDWYAQDSGGSIWYLGENTREYENGEVVSHEGAWEYGVDGAQAGILIPANPKPGCSYRQEYYEGEAEDAGQILSTKEDVKVRAGRYRDVLATGDSTPLTPWVLEHKFYAKGVGLVLAVGVSPDGAREELVKVSRPRH
ncbi:MAG: hypothetical protein ACR2JT_01095 [Nocardioidaceae bacterium]